MNTYHSDELGPVTIPDGDGHAFEELIQAAEAAQSTRGGSKMTWKTNALYALLAIAAGWALLIWPGLIRYSYSTQPGAMIRIDRITGDITTYRMR